jgi:hypothetical protein
MNKFSVLFLALANICIYFLKIVRCLKTYSTCYESTTNVYGQRHKKELQFGNNPLALKLNGQVPGKDSRRAAKVL